MTYTQPRTLNIPNIILFSVLTLLTVVGLPWYAISVGLTRADWVLFTVFAVATGFSITVGYHRLFSHRAFQAPPLITFLSLVFGAAAFEQSALTWSTLHRDHHQYVDTERDPYNIKQGFWYAHIGWMLFWRHEATYDNVKDLTANPLVMQQHRYYALWAIGAGVLLPLVIGAMTGHLLGAFLLSVAGRLTFIHHSTWAINSICHTFGKATYDIDVSARDHWIVAFLTNGEGFHNFHHRFPSDYRNGIRWYHWDPSKWVIMLLRWCRLAKNLYRASPHAILAARMTAQQRLLERQLAERKFSRHPHYDLSAVLAAVRERYDQLKAALYEWERREKHYRHVLAMASERSRTYLQLLKRQVAESRQAFTRAQLEWTFFLRTHPLIPRTALL